MNVTSRVTDLPREQVRHLDRQPIVALLEAAERNPLAGQNGMSRAGSNCAPMMAGLNRCGSVWLKYRSPSRAGGCDPAWAFSGLPACPDLLEEMVLHLDVEMLLWCDGLVVDQEHHHQLFAHAGSDRRLPA